MNDDDQVNIVTRSMAKKQKETDVSPGIQNDASGNADHTDLSDLLTDVTFVKPAFHQALEVSNLIAEEKGYHNLTRIRSEIENNTLSKLTSMFFIDHDILKRYWTNNARNKRCNKSSFQRN